MISYDIIFVKAFLYFSVCLFIRIFYRSDCSYVLICNLHHHNHIPLNCIRHCSSCFYGPFQNNICYIKLRNISHNSLHRFYTTMNYYGSRLRYFCLESILLLRKEQLQCSCFLHQDN